MSELKPPSLFEQHAQSIVAAVTLAILLGTGTLLVAMRDDIAGMKADMRHMSSQLNQAGDDRFRGADWRREKALLDERFYELRGRVAEMEKTIVSLSVKNGK